MKRRISNYLKKKARPPEEKGRGGEGVDIYHRSTKTTKYPSIKINGKQATQTKL